MVAVVFDAKHNMLPSLIILCTIALGKLSVSAYGQSLPVQMRLQDEPIDIAESVQRISSMRHQPWKKKVDANDNEDLDNETDISAAVTKARGATFFRKQADRQADFVSAVDYLQPGQSASDFMNGKIDAEPAIAAALATGKSVQLPCGYYLLNEPLPTLTQFGQALSGVSQSCTTIAVNFSSGDVIKYTGSYQAIHDLEFYVTKQMTLGAVIHAYKSGVSQLYNLNVQGGVYNGIVVDGANGTHITHVVLQPPFLPGVIALNPQLGPAYAGNSGITVTGDKVTGVLSVDTFINDVNISQYKFGLYVDYASGIYSGSGLDIVGSLHALIFTPGNGETVNGVQFTNVLGDTSYSDNWYFTGSGLINEIMCVNCWASSSITGAGLKADNLNVGSGQITFNSSTFLNNFAQGLNLNGMANWNLTNDVFEMNSRQGRSKAPDIGIYKNAGDFIRIQNSFIGKGGRIAALGAPSNATYAVDAIDYHLSGHLILSGNQASSHTVRMFNLPSNKGNVIVVDNQGN
ncbi:hypothetical protein [Acetobacter pasteurianus]|uniref:Pectate lyase superfamily protein domain-containing protein n=1 Tax=Acetobacter pasteurianus subsp. pasteurianus TaxID=481145 RepID=A0A1Y0Y433_ACEPA|nr:hypothetical protein [Acetobacter pasteurianus]ARW47217.1 hypothetical protein S1001342_00862 [Acetobacter pasteurianus subsp. pasteurianus]